MCVCVCAKCMTCMCAFVRVFGHWITTSMLLLLLLLLQRFFLSFFVGIFFLFPFRIKFLFLSLSLSLSLSISLFLSRYISLSLPPPLSSSSYLSPEIKIMINNGYGLDENCSSDLVMIKVLKKEWKNLLKEKEKKFFRQNSFIKSSPLKESLPKTKKNEKFVCLAHSWCCYF